MGRINKPSRKGKKEESLDFKLNINVSIPALDDDTPKAIAYAFDANNRLMESKPLPGGKGGKIEFKLKNQFKNQKVRVIIGPDLDMKGGDE